MKTYHNHEIRIYQYQAAYSGILGRPFAKVRGPLFTGEAVPLYGGRFAALLYACRCIKAHEKEARQ